MSPRASRLLALAVVLMPLLGLAPKYFIIREALAGQRIEQTTFGFGGYVDELLRTGQFRNCAGAPFNVCHPEQCQNATRMPGMPLLYAGIAHVVGEGSVAIDTVKCLLTALLLAGMLAVLVRDVQVSLVGVLVLYLLYFGPQSLKHGAAIEYEEGLLLDLELALAIAVSYLLSPALAAVATPRRVAMGLAAVAIAILMYFIKTTALPLLLVVVAVFALRARAGWKANLAVALLGIAPFAAWGFHTAGTSGTVHLSSSWNGENLFRGYNSASAAIYPQVSLDRLFDSREAVLEDGTIVPLGEEGRHQQCFVDEWAWNRSYGERAVAWLEANPLAALRFNLDKIWVALIEVRHTPYQVAATEMDAPYPGNISALMLIWMVLARLLWLWLVVRLLAELAGSRRPEALWLLALLGAAFAPYIIVFSYQRHVVPVLVMAGGLLVTRYYISPPPLHERHIAAR